MKNAKFNHNGFAEAVRTARRIDAVLGSPSEGVVTPGTRIPFNSEKNGNVASDTNVRIPPHNREVEKEAHLETINPLSSEKNDPHIRSVDPSQSQRLSHSERLIKADNEASELSSNIKKVEVDQDGSTKISNIRVISPEDTIKQTSKKGVRTPLGGSQQSCNIKVVRTGGKLGTYKIRQLKPINN